MLSFLSGGKAPSLRAIAAVVLVPLLLSACGTAVGAGAGGYAANRLSGGSTAATVGGVVGGGLLGHAVTGD